MSQEHPPFALLPCQPLAVAGPHPRVERGKTFLMAAVMCWASCSRAATPGSSRTSSGKDSSSKVTWGGQVGGLCWPPLVGAGGGGGEGQAAGPGGVVRFSPEGVSPAVPWPELPGS